MSRPRIVSIFGTRPEAIKMAPVVRAVEAAADLEHKLVITAQHRSLLDGVLELFGMQPDIDLDLMQQRQSLGYLTSAALTGLIDALARLEPEFVLVHGDTTTTFCASLAAFYRQVPFGHVEAGLRTSDICEPFPEEFNRRAVDLTASQLYCPTHGAAGNLAAAPGIRGEIFVTGNTAIDAIRLVADSAAGFDNQELAEFATREGPLLLLTAHRRENWGEPLAGFCRAALQLLEEFGDARLAVCWHPNPEVRDVIAPLLSGHPRVLLADPPRFDDFVRLMQASTLILTDSGGIQEEVTAVDRFALVLRDETERPEAVQAGFVKVIGRSESGIIAAVRETLPQCLSGALPAGRTSPFGDGQAALRIVQAVRWQLGLAAERPLDFQAG